MELDDSTIHFGEGRYTTIFIEMDAYSKNPQLLESFVRFLMTIVRDVSKPQNYVARM